MSYEPLHHKYRPQRFAELVGQDAIATTLTNAIDTGRIAPAYLFTGPRGTGKTSSARILAKSLNCLSRERPTAEPCGKCDVCLGIAQSSTLDVIEIDAASNTGIDNIREVIERAQFAPVQCRYKVYVVDECHMLSTAAFNALLKTLEEPPQNVVFVLATTDPQRVLPTIISRCQRFDFRRIALPDMVGHLSNIANQESINISQEAITLVAQIAQGGLRDAESLLDQLSLFSGEVKPEKVWDLVGSVGERDLLALLNAIAMDSAVLVLDTTRKILDKGREPLIILQNLAGFYRDLLIAQAAPNRQDLIACTEETWRSLVHISQQLDISTILQGQQHLRAAEVQIKNTTQPRLWLEVSLLGLLPSAQQEIRKKEFRESQANGAGSREKFVVQEHKPNQSTPQSQNHVATPKNTSPQKIHNPPISQVSPTGSNSQPDTDATFQAAPTNHNRPTDSTAPTQPNPPTPSTSQAIADNQEHQAPKQSLDITWNQVLANLPIPAQALLKQHGHLLSINQQVAVIGIPPKLIKLAQGKLADLEKAFAQMYQEKIKVNLVPHQSQHHRTAEQREITKNSSNSAPVVIKPSQPQPIPPKSELPPTNQSVVEMQQTVKVTTNNGNGNGNGNRLVSKNTNGVIPKPPSNPPKATSFPPQQERNWDTDEVMVAAKRLAQFFDGQVVDGTDDFSESTDAIAALDIDGMREDENISLD
ncbi:MAG: DNA polymerase III subunit gamma/tau [Richelia sp.]|nr:DNA polymerase III subunit gamma/tau [Richelia sp.]